jgi:hypothetical protein
LCNSVITVSGRWLRLAVTTGTTAATGGCSIRATPEGRMVCGTCIAAAVRRSVSSGAGLAAGDAATSLAGASRGQSVPRSNTMVPPGKATGTVSCSGRLMSTGAVCAL